MSKNKDLKYRAVCADCNKGFDTRKGGEIYWGKLICPDCYHKKVRYNELHDFMKRKYNPNSLTYEDSPRHTFAC